jgi:hypothetical protein
MDSPTPSVAYGDGHHVHITLRRDVHDYVLKTCFLARTSTVKGSCIRSEFHIPLSRNLDLVTQEAL